MIEFSNVSFKYEDGSEILSGLNLKIGDGEVVLLCGESGCGKSTVVRMINGLIPNYYQGTFEGQVLVNGLDTHKEVLYKIAEQVASVFQNPKTQFYNVDSTEEMVFGLENRGVSREKMKEKLTQTVHKFGMEDLLNRNLFAMSGGEKQKVACACADTSDAPIIVLDEPSSNLDIYSIRELAKIIAQWKKEGKTVIVAEHRLYYMLPLADRVIYMKDGVIELECAPKELTDMGVERISQMGLRSTDIYALSGGIDNVEPEAGSDNILKIRDFAYKYKGNKEPTLKISNLELPKNKVICIVGDNGAGKSTFARTLCGLDKRAEGILEYEGKPLKRKDRLKKTFMVMQDVAHQLFTDEVADELESCIDEPDESSQARIKELLEELNLSDKAERHPQSLSGGEKQRVAIGSAVIAQRDIIVFDEPTSGLDYRHMMAVAGLVRKLKEKGKTVFIITHDPELIAICCDELVEIGDGKVACASEMTPVTYNRWLMSTTVKKAVNKSGERWYAMDGTDM